mgnify:CR=1 FL=1
MKATQKTAAISPQIPRQAHDVKRKPFRIKSIFDCCQGLVIGFLKDLAVLVDAVLFLPFSEVNVVSMIILVGIWLTKPIWPAVVPAIQLFDVADSLKQP